MMFVEVEAGSQQRTATRWAFALPLVPITVSVFCVSALAYYQVHYGGLEQPRGLLQGFVVGLYGLLGFVPSFILCLLVLAWSSIWFFTGKLERPAARLGRLGGLALCLAILVNLGEGATAVVPPGGAIGEFLAVRFEAVFGAGLSTLLVSVAALAALLLATDYFFYRYFEPLGRPRQLGDLREETGTEAEAAEVLGSLPLPEVRSVATARAEVEPVDIVTGEDDYDDDYDDDGLGDAYGEDPGRRARRADNGHGRALAVDDDDDEPAEAALAAGDEGDRPDEDDAGSDGAGSRRWRARRHLRIDAGQESAAAGDEWGTAGERDAADAATVWEEDEGDEEVVESEDGDEAQAAAEDWEGAEDEDEDEDEVYDDEDEDQADDDDEDEDYGDVEDEETAEDEDEDDADAPDDEDADESQAKSGDDPAYSIPRPAGGRRQGELFHDGGDLLDEAARIVIGAHRASVTFLQRRMRVEYGTARELLEALRREGVIGGEAGAMHAPVLMDLAAWEER
jgi:hypothetical protein